MKRQVDENGRLMLEERRVGVFGGTFDPIHIGHMVAAQEALWALGLQRVIFVPCGEPPHKIGLPITPAFHRVRMVEAAICDNPLFVMSRIEVDREGPSYTVDTVEALIREMGDGTQLYFIHGLDSFLELPAWRSPRRLLSLCRMVVVTRPGFRPEELQIVEREIPESRGRVTTLEIPAIAVSSTDIHARVVAGRPIRYLVPAPVEEYIHRHQLYR